MRVISLLSILCFSILIQAQIPADPQDGSILIRDVTVHIGNGKEILDGAVGFREGIIDYVGSSALAPKEYDRIIEGEGQELYPGFIAVNSTLGLAEIGAVRATLDKREVGTFNPHVRSIIAYNTDSRITPTVRSNGVLMAQVSPQGGRISGTSSIVHLDAWNWEDAVVALDDGVHLNWPRVWTYDWKERKQIRNEDYHEQLEELRRFLLESRSYCLGAKGRVDLRKEAMCGCFDERKGFYVRTHRAQAMIDASNLTQELGIDRLVIVGGYDAMDVAPMLKERKVDVMISGVHGLPQRPDDAIDWNFKLPAQLSKAGVRFCLENSDSMSEMNTRNLPFQAGTCVAYGLDKRDAVKALTMDAAAILGIDDITGSIQLGKQATFFLSKGDALDMLTNDVTMAFIQGRSIDLDNHQKQSDRKYRAKYGLESN